MARVLIIDQDRMIAAIERDFLETNGFDVAVAMTGKEGMKLFDGGDIEAVILDVDLSDTDGFFTVPQAAGRQQRPHSFHHGTGFLGR